MKILIDNGHGFDTPGKCSPDGKYKELAWSREIAQMICDELTKRGHDARLILSETADIPLPERVRRVNEICGRTDVGNVLRISIHSNTSGNGDWMAARGRSAFISKDKTKADELATCIYKEAENKIRADYSDGDPDWAGGYILRKTKCPAVLTENFFHDNRDDVAYITSEEGKRAIVRTHVDGIINYIKQQGK